MQAGRDPGIGPIKGHTKLLQVFNQTLQFAYKGMQIM